MIIIAYAQNLLLKANIFVVGHILTMKHKLMYVCIIAMTAVLMSLRAVFSIHNLLGRSIHQKLTGSIIKN